jgi:GrpB-like predicted nucleotidyltransferase (UPF0157 family)
MVEVEVRQHHGVDALRRDADRREPPRDLLAGTELGREDVGEEAQATVRIALHVGMQARVEEDATLRVVDQERRHRQAELPVLAGEEEAERPGEPAAGERVKPHAAFLAHAARLRTPARYYQKTRDGIGFVAMVGLVPHRDSWTSDFESEAATVRDALGATLSRLHHIGSTAIPGIYARPIIDMLAEVDRLVALDDRRARMEVHPRMEALGYEAMGESGIPSRRYFRKDTAGVRSHQVHAFVAGSPHVVGYLAFRDYLRCHPDVAREYDTLKLRLSCSFDGDLVTYMNGKDPFIKEVERTAIAWRAATRDGD